MSKGIANAFRVPNYASILTFDSSSVPFWCLSSCARCPFQQMLRLSEWSFQNGAMAVLNLFSYTLSRMSVFSLGIMPFTLRSDHLQMMQSVIHPSMSFLLKIW